MSREKKTMKEAVLNAAMKAQMIKGLVCEGSCKNCGRCLVRLERFMEEETSKAFETQYEKSFLLFKQSA